MDLSESRRLRTTLHAALKAKEKENELLKAAKLPEATAEYTRGNDLLLAAKDLDLSEHPKAWLYFVADNLNLARVHLKLEQYDECVLFCDKVLQREPNNVKALYRKGEALFAAGHRQEAAALFEQVIKLEPKNKAARQYLLRFKELDVEGLPREILNRLCGFLGPTDILNMRLISRKLKCSLDANSMQFLEGMARSSRLTICRSPQQKWSFERKAYGKRWKSIDASDSSLKLLITVVSLKETTQEDGDDELYAWGYSNDIFDDEILTSLNLEYLDIAPSEGHPQLDYITDAVFDHLCACAIGVDGRYELWGCTKLTVEGLRSALKRFATHGKSMSIQLGDCANFPCIYTVIGQLGDLGQDQMELINSYRASYHYYYGTPHNPSHAIHVSVCGSAD